MSNVVKISSPATSEYWEVPVLFEDETILVLDKPPGLLVSPDRYDLSRPDMMTLLHRDIERGAAWTKGRGFTYLMNAHRLDFEASGVLVLAKSKAVLVELATQFGAEKATRIYVALVRGVAALEQTEFKTEAKLAPHPLQMGVVRVDTERGKRSRTEFTVRERFAGYMLMECRPLTERRHQVRVHLKHVGFKLVGDEIYGGPGLLLSTLKSNFRLKPAHIERPLIGRAALHVEQVMLTHPVTGAELKITSSWAKDLAVSVKYLRRYAPAN